MSRSTTIRSLGEHGFTRVIQKYADTVRLPNETSAQAFNRVFTSDDAEGQAIRKCWQIAKGTVVADSSERQYGLGDSIGVESGPLDPDEYDGADERITDDANADAMALLERLADKLRQRNPGMSKAQSFTRVYTDPQYAHLAKRERAQNRPRA
jgi:hypothetical protein